MTIPIVTTVWRRSPPSCSKMIEQTTIKISFTHGIREAFRNWGRAGPRRHHPGIQVSRSSGVATRPVPPERDCSAVGGAAGGGTLCPLVTALERRRASSGVHQGHDDEFTRAFQEVAAPPGRRESTPWRGRRIGRIRVGGVKGLRHGVSTPNDESNTGQGGGAPAQEIGHRFGLRISIRWTRLRIH